MILEISFGEQILVELVPILGIWLILAIRNAYVNLHERGYPVLSTLLKWNIWLLLPVWIGIVSVHKHLYGETYNYLFGPPEDCNFIIESEVAPYQGYYTAWYTISNRTTGNQLGYVSTQWIRYQDPEIQYKSNPDYLRMIIRDGYGNIESDVVYDKDGPADNRLQAFIMRNPFASSLIIVGLVLLLFNILLFHYARKRYYPYLKNASRLKS